MDLSSTFMGKAIKNPIIVSSSHLTSRVESIQKLADHGAAAIVLKSLFEEQILSDKAVLNKQDDMYYWYPEAVDFLDSFIAEEGISEYLQLIERTKKSVDIPVFASINCVSPSKWPKIAADLENSGADGLELNIFIPPSDIEQTGYQIEETYIDIIHEVRRNITLPVAVKIGSHFSNLYRTLFKLSNMEINSLVLFNREFRPDINIDNMRVVSDNVISSPVEITLSLRWIALMRRKAGVELIAATGIHDAAGIIKQILAGATSVQICSALYKNGVDYVATLLDDLQEWMKSKGYSDLKSFRGLVGANELNAASFERVQFMKKTSGRLL